MLKNFPPPDHLKKNLILFILFITLFLSIILRLSGIATEIQKGIPGWHADEGRYFLQCKRNTWGHYKPIDTGNPQYSGNPYGNVLFISLLWKGLSFLYEWMNLGHLPNSSLTFSLIGRYFYIFLSCIIVYLLFLISKIITKSEIYALLPPFIFSVSPLAIGLTHIIKPELPLTCFIVLSAYFSFLITKSGKLRYYILGGFFAGLATAMKYNGSIAMVYLFLMHAFWSFTINKKSQPIYTRLVKLFLSPYLFLSIIVWAASFYLFEPVLWHNISYGIKNIFAYLKVTAAYGIPTSQQSDFFHRFVFNLKNIPRNLLVLVESINPYFAFLAFIGFFVSFKKSSPDTIKIILLPLLFTGILLFTKPTVAEEYLLHPLPYIYVFTGMGCIVFFHLFPFKHLKALLGLPLLLFTLLYGSYIGFSEAKYFSLGNVTLYAKNWVGKNLRDQPFEIQKGVHLTRPSTHNPKNKCDVFIVKERFYTKTQNDILIKRFQIEKNKPLLHHLRPQSIAVFAKLGGDFTGKPIIPPCPIPLLSPERKNFTRFLNGINFDPTYNIYLLAPRKTYAWTIFSEHRMRSLTCSLQNGYATNKILINNKVYSLLPFEKRVVKIPLKELFPWRSPYRYIFSVKPLWRAILEFGTSPANTLNAQKINRLQPISNNRPEIKKLFKRLFNYDYKYLRTLTAKEIPFEKEKNITLSKNHVKKYQTPLNTPIFLKKGFYKLKISTAIYFTGKKEIQIAIVTASHRHILKKTLSVNELNLYFKTVFPHFYHIQIPFHVQKDIFAFFVIEADTNTCINLKKIIFKTDYLKMLKSKINKHYLLRSINSKNINKCTSLASLIDPEELSSKQSAKLAKLFYKNNKLSLAKRWYEIALAKNPIEKTYIKRLITICKTLEDSKVITKCEKALINLNNFQLIHDAHFETGFALKGISIPQKCSKSEPLNIHLFLKLPNISREQSAFLSFEKKGNFYFGKDFSLLQAKKSGEIYEIHGKIQIPPNLPPGNYNVFFTFRIPKHNYFYRLISESIITNRRKYFLSKIEFVDKEGSNFSQQSID